MTKARIRLGKAEVRGEILLEGQRATFTATINGPRVSADFQPHPATEVPLDEWKLFRALEAFIDEHLRG